ARFVDPDFALTVQQARFFGLEILHMADAEVLPLSEVGYAQAIHGYLEQARTRSTAKGMNYDYAAALASADSFAAAARVAHAAGLSSPGDAPHQRCADCRGTCAGGSGGASDAAVVPAGGVCAGPGHRLRAGRTARRERCHRWEGRASRAGATGQVGAGIGSRSGIAGGCVPLAIYPYNLRVAGSPRVLF